MTGTVRVLGPHETTTGRWVFVALLQSGLIALAAFVVRFAAGRPPLERRRLRAATVARRTVRGAR